MAAPAGDAVPLQPLDPGAGRRARSGLVVLVALVALLAWQPWKGSDERVAVPDVSPVPRLADARPRESVAPTQRPGWPPTPPPRPFAPLRVGTLPPDWGVAAYLERLAGEGGEGGPLSRDLLLRKVPIGAAQSALATPRAARRVCAPEAATDVAGATIESERVRVLGVTVPADAARARITVRALTGELPAVRAVTPRARRLDAERLRPPYALFALPRYAAWPAGVYRFDVHLPGGAFRYVYACIAP